MREVWKHEAYEFSSWLEENFDVLNDVLDLNLRSGEREKAAGDFYVDLVVEDDTGHTVIVENQLGRSDHDHLGKLVTYLTAFEAKTAIWIVSAPRPEHVRAIAWLNEASSANFYLLKLEAIRIGDSLPAPLLTVIVGPSEESREVGEVKRELAERHHAGHRFWTEFLEYARTRTPLHTNISPSHETWIGTGAGRSGITYNYVVNQHDARVELYIDRGKDSYEENKAIFDQLEVHKADIEQSFGEPLDWQRLESKQSRRIAKYEKQGGYRDEEKRQEIFQAMVEAMIRLERAMSPYIGSLRP